MAIDMFIQARANLVMLEKEVENIIKRANEVAQENQLLRNQVDNLNNELKKLKENESGKNDHRSSEGNVNGN